MLEIKKKDKEKVSIFGVTYEVAKPTVKQMLEFVEKSKSPDFSEAKESLKVLVSLGLPEEVIMELESEDFQALTKYLFEPKKK